MKKNCIRFVVSAFLLFGSIVISVQARAPLLLFNPLTSTTLSVSENSTALVQYQVINQSNKPHTMTMQPIHGITQLTTGQGICGNPFVLHGKSSCTLSLQINGNQLINPIVDGPVVCQQNSTLLCYRPNKKNILRATQAAPITDAVIAVTGSPLTLSVNGTGQLTITNTSTEITATNVAADFTGTALEGKVTETGNTCANLLPGENCLLTFTAGNQVVPSTAFPIQGDNTSLFTANMKVEIAGISVTGSPLTILVNNSGQLTVTNTSAEITVTNIAADFTGTALEGKVTETGNTCANLLPGENCLLTFTAGNQVVPSTDFPIQGDNINTFTASMTIDAAGITVTGSPLTIMVNDSGQLTVTNTSAEITATNIVADFTGTALEGKVTETGNTCANLLPGDNCLLTFTAGNQVVPLTNFTIQGNNTSLLTAVIEIEAQELVIGELYEGGVIGCIADNGCQGADRCISKNLLVPLTNQSTSIRFSNAATGIGAGAQSFDDGDANTQAAITVLGVGALAVNLCTNLVIDGKTGWYLPSVNELGCLRQNRDVINAASSDSFVLEYWSSTERSENTSQQYTRRFDHNAIYYLASKTSFQAVRCVRAIN